MARVALLSGGKDSFYAAMQRAPIDYGLVLVYSFPRPSPHLLNLGKTVETLLLAGFEVVVARLPRGAEREHTVRVLQGLGADEVVAGDVYIEDHLRYMEGVAREAGASLSEPLWGMDPEELLYREMEAGISAVVTGADERLGRWLGRVLDRGSAAELASEARRLGLDPLGERGEYHTLVIDSPLHERRLGYHVCSYSRYPQGYLLLRVC